MNGVDADMEKQKRNFFSKEILFAEWVFFCSYWGFYAIAWHFAALLKVDGDYVLYDIGFFLHIIALAFYIIGVILVSDRRGILFSHSSKSSDA